MDCWFHATKVIESGLIGWFFRNFFVFPAYTGGMYGIVSVSSRRGMMRGGALLHYCLSSGQAVPFAEGEGRPPVGRIFLECTGSWRSGRREENLSGWPPSPCFDSCNPLSRQRQVSKPTDTSLCRDRHKCLSRQTQVSDKAIVNI